MAFAHNAMLRGINSIYLQAPHVHQPKDIADLLFLVKSWSTWVSHHHLLEETQMFPGFESVAGQKGLLDGNVEQHHSFEPGLKKLQSYAVDTKSNEYDGKHLQAIIDEFATSLKEHLYEEINTLLALRPYDGPALLKVYKECEASAGDQPKASFLFNIG